MSQSFTNDRVFIVVMGATGTGKSTFINLASGSSLRVGEGLESCTDQVHSSHEFELGGQKITLLDTPGFDDSNKSDTEILAMITAFLGELYENGTKLAGVIYAHRISDFRMVGSSSRNFKLFCNLCGDDVLKNSVIVTNMWSEVDHKKGEMREAELRNKFFKPAIDKGAKLLRHNNTVESTQNILREVIYNAPLPLRVQIELVDKKMKLVETAAGAELNREMLEMTRKQEAEINRLLVETEEAMRIKDEETKQELEEERRELQLKMDKMKYDAENLDSAYREQKGVQEWHVRSLTDKKKRGETVQKRDSGRESVPRVINEPKMIFLTGGSTSLNRVQPFPGYEQPDFAFEDPNVKKARALGAVTERNTARKLKKRNQKQTQAHYESQGDGFYHNSEAGGE